MNMGVKMRTFKVRKQHAHGENQKTLSLNINIPLIGVTQKLKNMTEDSTIADTKHMIELLAGIPSNIQRLFYIDMSELTDSVTLRDIEIVPFATLVVHVWSGWQGVLEYVHARDPVRLIECIFRRLGSSQTSSQSKSSSLSTSRVSSTTTNEALDLKQNESTSVSDSVKVIDPAILQRGSFALFLAANRGYENLITVLLEHGIDVNSKTQSGYTAVDTAVACGQYSCIDFLLENGAVIDFKSDRSKFALNVAKQYGFTDSERHLLLFDWKQRSKKIKCRDRKALMMHQQFDSGNPTWLRGKYATKYLCATLPPGEFSGTGIDAPKSVVK